MSQQIISNKCWSSPWLLDKFEHLKETGDCPNLKWQSKLEKIITESFFLFFLSDCGTSEFDMQWLAADRALVCSQ